MNKGSSLNPIAYKDLPTFQPIADWIYFDTNGSELWRVKLDGTRLE